MARALQESGDELMLTKDVELTDSLAPKCEELERMADALSGALDRRAQVLRLSKNMHEQISEVGTLRMLSVSSSYRRLEQCRRLSQSSIYRFSAKLASAERLGIRLVGRGPIGQPPTPDLSLILHVSNGRRPQVCGKHHYLLGYEKVKKRIVFLLLTP